MRHPKSQTLARSPFCVVPSVALAGAALALACGLAGAVTLRPIRVSARVIHAPSALALSSKRAEAPVLKPITISAPVFSAPVTRTIGYDSATNAPVQEITVRARVRFNPVILTTHSGVALLGDDVAEAARSACDSIAPLDGDGACVRRAIESAQPQVTAAITRARSSEAG